MIGADGVMRARPQDRPDPARPLTAVVAARDAWLAEASAVLHADPRVAAVVLVGSLARSDGDAFSDVDGVAQPDNDSSADVHHTNCARVQFGVLSQEV